MKEVRVDILFPREGEEAAALFEVIEVLFGMLDVLVDGVHLVIHTVQLLWKERRQGNRAT